MVDFTRHQVSWGLCFSSLFEVGMLTSCADDRIMCYRLRCRMTASGSCRAGPVCALLGLAHGTGAALAAGPQELRYVFAAQVLFS